MDETTIREGAVAELRAGRGLPVEAWSHVWLPIALEADSVRAVHYVRAFWGFSVADLAEALGLEGV